MRKSSKLAFSCMHDKVAISGFRTAIADTPCFSDGEKLHPMDFPVAKAVVAMCGADRRLADYCWTERRLLGKAERYFMECCSKASAFFHISRTDKFPEGVRLCQSISFERSDKGPRALSLLFGAEVFDDVPSGILPLMEKRENGDGGRVLIDNKVKTVGALYVQAIDCSAEKRTRSRVHGKERRVGLEPFERVCDGAAQIPSGIGHVEHVGNIGDGAPDAVLEGGRDLDSIVHDGFEAPQQNLEHLRHCRRGIRYSPCGAVPSPNRSAPALASRDRRCA